MKYKRASLVPGNAVSTEQNAALSIITNHTRILYYKNIPYIGHSCQYIAENVSIYCVKFINI